MNIKNNLYMKETNVCFHPDTEVWTVSGPKKISEITEEVKVYAKGEWGIDHVNVGPAFLCKEAGETLKLSLSNGDSITVSPETKFYVQYEGWIEASQLKARDKIVIFTDDMLVERSIRSIKPGETTDLWALDGNGSMIAGESGFCVSI